MRNIHIVVKPDEKPSDIIEQICEDEKIRFDDYFAFSAIMTRDKDPGYYNLKINCLEPPESNPYTPQTLISQLFTHHDKDTKFCQPELELYLTAFRPLLNKIIHNTYPYYKKLIPDRDDHISILYLTIVNLYNKGYYLHNRLINKSYINAMNKEVRKIKNFLTMASLDEEIGTDDTNSTITLLDQLADPVTSEEAYNQFHYTEEDYWEETFNLIKEVMLQDMSKLAFERILIQLKTKTVDRGTSGKLAKYREMFSPDYKPRPNRKGKDK